jgi:CubicO group peptidase (beta-lactamase class C family)
LTAEDVGTWLDGFLPYALHQGDIAGAVVIVVKDDKVLFEKGYGYADVATRRPVLPDTTLFRLASISKLFTWTAVMQLVEKRALDLDADINGYLDFQVPPDHGKPITLHELMTHTAGFEEHGKNLFVRSEAALIPLGEYERKQLPARIFPPGQVAAYSNYGAGLAGYIVQRVSGELFEEYIERHVFAPLGMAHATFRQPLPAALTPDMSSSYALGSGPARSLELSIPAPAGALSASASDISRFMIAHLNEGHFGAAQILSPEMTRLMHARAYRTSPEINGMTLGFFEADRNGHRAISHGGDLSYFHSDLTLLPDDRVGIFIALNSAGAGAANIAIRLQLYRGFMDRYFPAPAPDLPRWQNAEADGRLIAGWYEGSRRSQTTIGAALRLAQQLQVQTLANGDLTLPLLDSLTGSPQRTWQEIAPFLWQEVGGKARLAAMVKDGHVEALTTDAVPAFAVLQPVPWGLRRSWLAPALAGAVAILALVAILWPGSALVRRHYRAPFPLKGSAATLHRLVRVTALVDLLFLTGWAAALIAMSLDLTRANARMDPWLRALQALGVLGLLGGGLALWNLVLALKGGQRSWSARISSLAIVMALGVVTWVEFIVNAFSLSLNY